MSEPRARRAGANTAPPQGGRSLWLSDWAARDLAAKPGSRVTLHFDLWREAGRLEPQSVEFTLAGIVPDTRAAEDRALVPPYPGLSDAKSLGEWDPPFPIELARIRPKDEDFWKKYGPAPKAYLDIATARELFGDSGSRLTTLFTKTADEATPGRDVLRQLREGTPPFIVQDLASASGASCVPGATAGP